MLMHIKHIFQQIRWVYRLPFVDYGFKLLSILWTLAFLVLVFVFVLFLLFVLMDIQPLYPSLRKNFLVLHYIETCLFNTRSIQSTDDWLYLMLWWYFFFVIFSNCKRSVSESHFMLRYFMDRIGCIYLLREFHGVLIVVSVHFFLLYIKGGCQGF